MDPKSTPEQSVISDERASLQRAVILSCWKLTIIGRLGPQKLRLGPEKLPVGPCPFRSGDFSAPSRDFSAPSGDFVSPTRRFQKATRADTGATRTHRGRARGADSAHARPTPLARPRVGAREADTRRRGGWGLGAARLHYPLGEAPGPAQVPLGGASGSAPLPPLPLAVLWGPFLFSYHASYLAYSLDKELDILQCSVDTAG